MTARDDLDRFLSAWADDPFSPPAPHYLPQVLDVTRHTRQRRAWTSRERWLPVTLVVDRPIAGARRRPVWLIALLLLAGLVATAGAGIIGARLLSGWDLRGPDRPAVSEQDAATRGPLHGVVALAAGEQHTCALMADGGVRCWGSNGSGQLGDGSRVDRSVPVPVAGVEGANAVAAGLVTTCALVEHTVLCWGFNANGELTGTDSGQDQPAPDVLTPVEIPELRGATDLVMEGDQPCAVMDSGAVRCRTRPTRGRGASTPRPAGTSEVDIAASVAVVGGDSHLCALAGDGTVACWGRIRYGSLGEERRRPVPVEGVEGATAIAAGGGRTCVVASGGHVWCWGQTGAWGADGNAVVDLRPVEIGDVTGAIGVSVARTGPVACAVLGNGHVRCWGDDALGQVGDGTRLASAEGVEVRGVDDAVEVAVGGGHACARTSTGEVRCWGSNDVGQLGGGTVARNPETVPVRDLAGARALASRWASTCAIVSGGRIRCWGSNAAGELGDGSRTTRLTPVEVRDVDGAVAVAIGDSGAGACAIVSGGRIRCWGGDSQGSAPSSEPGLPAVDLVGITGATQLAMDANHACALTDAGQVRCWDPYAVISREPGVGTMNPALTDIPGLDGATAVTAGLQHLCAIVAEGRVRCWGYRGAGQLGDGAAGEEDVTFPVEVAGLTGATAIAAGYEFTCALRGDGRAWCWGDNGVGELGDGTGTTRLVPVEVADIDGATALAAHGSHACVIVAGGEVRCWGGNRSGQLGDGTVSDRWAPVVVHGIAGASAIAAGSAHTCAVVAGGEVRCWGASQMGELGDGSDASALTTVLAGTP